MTKQQEVNTGSISTNATDPLLLKGSVTRRSRRNIGDKKTDSNTVTTDGLPPKSPVTGRSRRNVVDYKTESNNFSLDGLLLKGSVTGRSRRNVGDNKIELVTYKICAGNNIYFVKDWAPKDYLSVGQLVELPIYVKSFHKDGHVMLDYTICSYSPEEF